VVPTVENFAELLREEVNVLLVMYRYGELYSGFTSWTGWTEANIEHIDAEGTFTREEGFNVVGSGGHHWSYEGRLQNVERAYQGAGEGDLGGFVFGRYHRDEGNEHCIQIVFMDTFNKQRRATRNIKANKA